MDVPTLTIDFETYYSDDFQIRRSSPLEYLRDPQFKVHGAGIKVDDSPAIWVRGEDLQAFLDEHPRHRIVAHNANFDCTILHEKFNYDPLDRVDTLGLARALLLPNMDLSLESLAQALDLGTKGEELLLSKGLRDLPPTVEEALAGYAKQDAELCYKLYALLWPHLPDLERRVMNIVVRMSTEGSLRLDGELARQILADIETDRTEKLEAAGVTIEQVRSAPQFAELLRSRGVEPPMKISPTTGKPTYAFAQQDPDFVLLRTNPKVADLIEARTACTSNTAATRLQRLINITDRAPHTIPVQLGFCGAHTGRLSGGGRINMQNLPALYSRGPQRRLREAIMASPGSVIVVRDLSGIELRMNMWFSRQEDALHAIRTGGDLYRIQAATQFSKHVDQVTDNERQFGKIVELGLGYSMGHGRFREACAAGLLGQDPLYLDEVEAVRVVQLYRSTRNKVVESWRWFTSEALPRMLFQDCHYERGPITLIHEGILLPGGHTLKYPGLTSTEDGWFWSPDGRSTHWIHAGLLQENVVQALAGVVLKEHMVRIDDEIPNALLVHQVHDELLAVCSPSDADEVSEAMAAIMSTPIDWAPDLPLDTEGDWNERYVS